MVFGDLDLTKWEPLISEDKPNVVYILRLCSGGLYIGSTTDFCRRMKEHTDQLGLGSRLTRKNVPVEVVRVECFETYLEARHREEQIKGWTKAKKEALIQENKDELRCLAEGKIDRRK